MLKNLQITNVALIDSLSIDFCQNLNVLSGETGAGKSIVIDALNFVIGAKTPKSLIKQGKDFMMVPSPTCTNRWDFFVAIFHKALWLYCRL